MSNALYPTQLSPHPSAGALMAYRDGVFGQRPQAQYGQSLTSFQNGVFGPSLGSAEHAAPLDSGPLRSFRDGIFNFPRHLQQQPHPVMAYQDGIFGGASLGQTSEAPAAVDEGGDGAPSEAPAPTFAPASVALDLTDPATVGEVVDFMRQAGSAAQLDVSAGGSGPKQKWDGEASALTKSLVEQLAALVPEEAEQTKRYGMKKVGDYYYPTGSMLVALGMNAGAAGGMADASSYPRLVAFLTSCMSAMVQAPSTSNVEEAAVLAEQACPVIYPEPSGISRTTMIYVGGAVAAVGLAWLVMRRR